MCCPHLAPLKKEKGEQTAPVSFSGPPAPPEVCQLVSQHTAAGLPAVLLVHALRTCSSSLVGSSCPAFVFFCAWGTTRCACRFPSHFCTSTQSRVPSLVVQVRVRPVTSMSLQGAATKRACTKPDPRQGLRWIFVLD